MFDLTALTVTLRLVHAKHLSRSEIFNRFPWSTPWISENDDLEQPLPSADERRSQPIQQQPGSHREASLRRDDLQNELFAPPGVSFTQDYNHWWQPVFPSGQSQWRISSITASPADDLWLRDPTERVSPPLARRMSLNVAFLLCVQALVILRLNLSFSFASNSQHVYYIGIHRCTCMYVRVSTKKEFVLLFSLDVPVVLVQLRVFP